MLLNICVPNISLLFIHLTPPLTDFKGPTTYICYRWISIVANNEKLKNNFSNVKNFFHYWRISITGGSAIERDDSTVSDYVNFSSPLHPSPPFPTLPHPLSPTSPQNGELRRMAEMVQTGCEKAVGEHHRTEAAAEAGEDDETNKPANAGRPKGKGKGARFKLSPGVEVNATQMFKSSQELAPIAGLLPKEAKLRKKWTIQFYVKPNTNWDCAWDKEVRL